MIKQKGIVRDIDQTGRVVIPNNMKTELGWKAKERLEVFIDEDKRQIVLQKIENVCLKCGATEHLKEIKPRFALCLSCIETLLKD